MPELGLGIALRTLRDRRGLNVREVGKLSDVDHAYIYRLESGEKANPSEEMIAKLLKTLKAGDRDATIVRWLANHEADPSLVVYVLERPEIEFDAFVTAASVRHRGQARPDPAILIKRAQLMLQEFDAE